MRRQLGELLLTAVLLVAALAVFLYGKPSPRSMDTADHACCHAKIHATAAAASLIPIAAQDPGQDGEEGNPSHTRPKQACNHKPGGNQVQCHCVTDCGGDGSPREDRRCKSYCFKDMCSCPRRPCP